MLGVGVYICPAEGNSLALEIKEIAASIRQSVYMSIFL